MREQPAVRLMEPQVQKKLAEQRHPPAIEDS
jgi:hypothetical protein